MAYRNVFVVVALRSWSKAILFNWLSHVCNCSKM